MGAPGARHLVLDAGALIAIERADRVLLRALELADEVHVPAGALAQVWRNPVRQVRLARLVRTQGTTVHDLNVEGAKAAGRICGLAGTADIVDASVVVLAREVYGVIVTSDPGDIGRLAPDLRVVPI